MNEKQKKLSIVVPVFFNEKNIPHTVPRLQNLDNLLPQYDLEFIFVDDGSEDLSLKLLLAEQKKDKRIKIIKLTRNFGVPHGAKLGLQYAKGDCVALIAADMQDPPELLVEMIKKWEEGKKVVLGVRKEREDPFSERILSNTFYYLFRKFAMSDYPKGGFDLFLLDRQVVDLLNARSEKNTNIQALIIWLGFEQDYVYYKREKRLYGESRWTLSKKVKTFIDSFVSFSFFPIRFISYFGLVVSFLAFLYGVFIGFNAILGRIPVKGWTTLIVITTFLLGIIIIMLGVIGEYLWRVLDEVRDRPSYIIEKTFMEDEADETSKE